MNYQGVLQHPPIVLEFIKWITPLDYMMLRRASSIFMRNPSVYPSVEEMGFADFPCSNSGVPILLILHGDDDSTMDPMMYYEGIPIAGVYFNKRQNKLSIYDLETVRKRTFIVDTAIFAKLYLQIGVYHIDAVVDQMFAQFKEYADYNFTVIVKHNPWDTLKYVTGGYYDDAKLTTSMKILLSSQWNKRIAFYMNDK